MTDFALADSGLDLLFDDEGVTAAPRSRAAVPIRQARRQTGCGNLVTPDLDRWLTCVLPDAEVPRARHPF